MVTIPIGAIVTIGLRIDLQGLAFAVVTGYTITATVLFACIIISDWEMLSKAIQDQVCAGDLSDDSSDDDGSTSSSSSKEGEFPNSQTREDFRQHHLSLQ